MSDLVTPDAFVRDMVRARKEHSGCECGNPIRKGCLYERVSGIWDGCPARFKTCVFCVYVRQRTQARKPMWDDGPSFGELYSYLREVRS